MNRNRLFLTIITLLLFVLFLFSPMKRILTRYGIMTYDNVGNEIKGDGSVVSDALKFIEDTYTNYSPLYNTIVREKQMAEFKINSPLNTLFMNLAMKEKNKKDQKTKETEAESSAESETDREESTAGEQETKTTEKETEGTESETAETTEAETGKPTEPETETPTEAESLLASYSAQFINATATHRNYLFSLTLKDGTRIRFLDRVVSISESEKTAKLNNSIENLQRIFSYKTDKVHYYLYSGSRFQDMPYFSDYVPTEESSFNDLQKLFDAMPSTVRYDYLKFTDGLDRAEKIYLTDHHWQAKGYDTGYRDILSMMAKDTKDIGSPLTGKETAFDRAFNGSFSHFSNYYGISDFISYMDYGSLEYTTYGSGLRPTKAAEYFNENPDAGVSYEAFFPTFDMYRYPDNHTGRNLLIIGDSFARCIAEPLSSHFDTTFVLYQWSGADLGRYIDTYKVTDIVLLMYSDRLMYTIYNEINWSNYLTR